MLGLYISNSLLARALSVDADLSSIRVPYLQHALGEAYDKQVDEDGGNWRAISRAIQTKVGVLVRSVSCEGV